jgi:hypothetical protein
MVCTFKQEFELGQPLIPRASFKHIQAIEFEFGSQFFFMPGLEFSV